MNKDMIVEALADFDPWLEGECLFCDQQLEFVRNEGHNDGCIYAASRKLIK